MIKKGIGLGLMILMLAPACGHLARNKPYDSDAVPMHASKERMEWWNDRKFGLFIHWGPWSQTEIGAIWQITRKDAPDVREKRFDLYKTFNPVKFNPDKWARLAKRAGMRYVVFVTKHHDGFSNFDTKATDFSIMNPGCPYSNSAQPDLTRQIVDAFRKQGLAIGLYFSHIDWHHPDGKYFSKSHWDYDESLIEKEPDRWARFVEFERAQVRELLTNYGKVDILWFDISWPFARKNEHGAHIAGIAQVKKDTVELVRMARKLNPELIINNRGVDVYGDFETPEQKVPGKRPDGYWETNMTISDPHRRKGGGFWYKGPDAEYKSMDELLRVMGEVFSKGGNFLLNVGPRPDGLIPAGEIQRLREIGKWMKVNGEAVYGTQRSPFPDTPEWGYVTLKGQRLYLWVFDWQQNRKNVSLDLKSGVKKAWLLKDGSPVEFTYRMDGTGVDFNLPRQAPDDTASIVVVQFEGEPHV